MFQIPNKSHKNSKSAVSYLITDYRYLMTPLALALSGCMGVYEGGFECPPGEGVGCKSISEVNQMVNQGDLPSPGESKDSQTKKGCFCGVPHGEASSLSSEVPTIWYPPWILENI